MPQREDRGLQCQMSQALEVALTISSVYHTRTEVYNLEVIRSQFVQSILSLQLRVTIEVIRIGLGVFANNPAARKCYASVGFTENENVKPVIYSINDEEWECIELLYKVEKWRIRTEK